jgi:hypothetical protein
VNVKKNMLSFEVLTAVSMKMAVFWAVAPHYTALRPIRQPSKKNMLISQNYMDKSHDAVAGSLASYSGGALFESQPEDLSFKGS